MVSPEHLDEQKPENEQLPSPTKEKQALPASEKKRPWLEVLMRATGIILALGGSFAMTWFAFEVRPPAVDNPEALLIFGLTVVDLYALGMMFSSLYLLYGREAWNISNLLTEPISFISGLYYPVQFFPFWLQVLASLIPMTLGLDVMRKMFFYSSAISSESLEVEILAIMAPVLIVLAKLSLDYLERLSKKEGRLTLKWQ